MSRVLAWLGAGALVGVGFMYGLQLLLEPGDSGAGTIGDDGSSGVAGAPERAGAGTQTVRGDPGSLARPSAEDPVPSDPPPGEALPSGRASLAELPSPDPVWSRADRGAPSKPRDRPSATFEGPDRTVDEMISLADAAFATGNVRRGTQLLRGVFQGASDRHNVDLTDEARKLLEHDEDPRARIEYLRYLRRRGYSGEAFGEQLARANILAASDEREPLRRAWDELTVAYEVAIDAAERRKVLAILEPYIDRMILSGRDSPLLKSHEVMPGDGLWKIAIRYHTTMDALRRLNRHLKSDQIQPRMRLRVLPGIVEIFVDKSEYRLWLTVDDRVLLERPVGLGRDNSTPSGRFTIRFKQKDPTWFRPGQPPVPAGDPRNILGSRWLGFEDTEKHSGLGIHGTDNRSDLGRDSSSGCVRLLREDMELVFDFVPRGTAVTMQE